MLGRQWHQLDYMQIICILLQTDNYARCQHLITQLFTGRMLFLTPSQQCESIEGKFPNKL